MHRIRSARRKRRVAQIQRAIAITGKAFERVLRFVKPGVKEYEIEAEITHEFVRNGSRGHAYTPIIASGYNACVLHYITNDHTCNDGDVILMDFGCEYGGYASDLTRSIPVNGRFTKRQRDVYNAVLRVQKEATTNCCAPAPCSRTTTRRWAASWRRRIDRPGPVGQEGRGQTGSRKAALQEVLHARHQPLPGPGCTRCGPVDRAHRGHMVFTVEPGIYIREEKLGIRIENNILVTRDAPIDLFDAIPREVEEIEEMMAKGMKAAVRS
jgi:Xaa-Pro aminopeptidase